MVTYSPVLPTEVSTENLDSNSQCVFCGKQDIIRKMYIASLHTGVEKYPATGIRIFPIDPTSYVFLCEWCAHFDSKATRDAYTYWLLDQLMFNSAIGEGEISDYNGIL